MAHLWFKLSWSNSRFPEISFFNNLNNNSVQIVLVIEYDGAAYCGYQYQDNIPTVQDEIEKSLLKLTGEKIRVIAASRTDSGVHAKAQVISFRTAPRIKTNAYVTGLNHYLPQDIAVKAAYKINTDLNVQKDAVKRHYQYRIINSSMPAPLDRFYAYQVSGKLDIEAMNQASSLLVGEKDMASFVTEFRKSNIKSTVKTVYSAGVIRDGERVTFEMVARSFLPHQIRNTVGSLIRVGQGKINLTEFQNIMEARKPGLAGPTVPAQGLCLIRVEYPRPLGEYDEDL